MCAANAVVNVFCTHLVLTEGLHSDEFAEGGMRFCQ